MPTLPKYTGPRFKLELGKYPVLQVRKMPWGAQQFLLKLGDTNIEIDAPHDADIREGDLLSLYTEVALAIPQRPPID